MKILLDIVIALFITIVSLVNAHVLRLDRQTHNQAREV